MQSESALVDFSGFFVRFFHEAKNHAHNPNETVSLPLEGLGLSVDDPGGRWSWVDVEWISIGSASSALAASDQPIDGTIVIRFRIFAADLLRTRGLISNPSRA